MGANCAPLVADLDFVLLGDRLHVSDNYQADVIETVISILI